MNYTDAYILVTGDLSFTGNGAGTALAFKICAPFIKYRTLINDVFADTAENIDIAMPMYIFIEYSDNYSASLWLFKRDEAPANNANVKVTSTTKVFFARK